MGIRCYVALCMCMKSKGLTSVVVVVPFVGEKLRPCASFEISMLYGERD